jgi:16S rRNA G966 N2-methylase RsmD
MKMTQYLKWKADSSKGEVFTPIELVCKILDKIPEEVWRNPSATFLDPCMGKGTFLLEIVRRLVYIYGYTEDDAKSRVYGYDIRVKYVNHLTRRGLKNVRHKDFLNEVINMEFDVVLGNPPYQLKVGPNKTESLWNKFVKKSFEICRDGGYVSLIHPNGWRNIDGKYKDIQQLLKSKNITYLSLNGVEEGQKIFNATTPFDWYVVKNIENSQETLIKFQDNTTKLVDLRNIQILPNGMFEEIMSLVANGNEDKVNMIHSYSAYETRQNFMSKTSSEEYPYPCVYSVLTNGNVNFMYSSNNQRGHFGVPKLIFGNGTNPTSIIDSEGQYGLTQFAFGIVDSPENLPLIERAIKSEKFQKINKNTKYVATAGNPLVYPKIVELFRKDFWREFIDD